MKKLLKSLTFLIIIFSLLHFLGGPWTIIAKAKDAETGSSLRLSLGVASVSSLLASIGLYLLSKITNGKDWRKKKRRK